MTQPPIIPGYQPQPAYIPPPPKKGLGGGKIALIVAACAGVPILLCVGFFVVAHIVAGNSPDTSPSRTPAPGSPILDAKILGCSGQDNLTARVRVTNSGTKRHYYTVTVVFLDSKDQRVDSDSIYLGAVEPNFSAEGDATGFAPRGLAANRCAITNVVRA